MDNGTGDVSQTMMKLDTKDIELIVRLLHQELDAVHTVMENTKDGYTPIEWYNRADHCEDLIMQLLR